MIIRAQVYTILPIQEIAKKNFNHQCWCTHQCWCIQRGWRSNFSSDCSSLFINWVCEQQRLWQLVHLQRLARDILFGNVLSTKNSKWQSHLQTYITFLDRYYYCIHFVTSLSTGVYKSHNEKKTFWWKRQKYFRDVRSYMGYIVELFFSADMKIWIDPNGGHDYDKLQVSCEFRSKISWTCIYPQKYLVS